MNREPRPVAGQPADRVLILHSYPPTPCLYTFEKGLRELGHDVVSVGPTSPDADSSQFRELEPQCSYLSAEPDVHLDEIFVRCSSDRGGSDRRIILPSELGLSPVSDLRMARSISLIAPMSNGLTAN